MNDKNPPLGVLLYSGVAHCYARENLNVDQIASVGFGYCDLVLTIRGNGKARLAGRNGEGGALIPRLKRTLYVFLTFLRNVSRERLTTVSNDLSGKPVQQASFGSKTSSVPKKRQQVILPSRAIRNTLFEESGAAHAHLTPAQVDRTAINIIEWSLLK
jgi:hypothetical protein